MQKSAVYYRNALTTHVVLRFDDNRPKLPAIINCNIKRKCISELSQVKCYEAVKVELYVRKPVTQRLDLEVII